MSPPSVGMLDRHSIELEARRLRDAELGRRQVRATTCLHPSVTLDDAYAIQKRWVEARLAEGRSIIGYKIGLTSRAMQAAMGIDEPDYGVLLDHMRIGNGAAIEAAAHLDPRVEVELAFVLNKTLHGPSVTVDEVLDATDYVVPALELIAARSFRVDPQTGRARTICDTVADNAANAGILVGGERIGARDHDLRWIGAMLYRNGVIEETGLAGGVLGHPAEGVAWVARRFARHGIALEPGHIVLAGSFTRPVAVAAGDDIVADYGAFGSLRCRFT